MLFPELAKPHDLQPAPACYIPSGKHQRKLVARHLSNNKPLLDHRFSNVPLDATG